MLLLDGIFGQRIKQYMMASQISKFLVIIFVFFCLFGCQNDDEISTKEIAYDLQGYVQKGPFINGTTIIVSELNQKLVATGKNFNTQIIDNKGSFNLKSVKLKSNFIQIIAEGFYFNEVRNKKSATQLTLFGLANVIDISSVNINLLSHLEKDRVIYLMQEEEKSFHKAKKQAQQEVLSVFGIKKSSIISSELLDISQDGDDNAILLAVSAILQGNNTVAELSELLANFITDIREDGVLDSKSTREKIRINAMLLKPSDIRQHLEDRYEELGVSAVVPNFEQYIDSDGDGLLNKDEDDTPDEFTFEPQTDVAIDTTIVSNEIVISGLKETGKTIARVEGGTLIVNDQKVIGDSTQVSNQDRIRLSLHSSSEYATSLVTKLTINTLIRKFSATTDDYIPDNFSFTSVENAKRDSLYTSETILLSGLPHATLVSLNEGMLFVNNERVEANEAFP